MNTIPDDINNLSLAELGALTQETRSTELLRIFGNNLLLATFDVLASNDVTIRTQYAQMWLHRSVLHAELRDACTLPLANFDKCFMLMSTPGVVEELAQNQQNIPMLAAVCVQAVCGEDSLASDIGKIYAADLLSRMTGNTRLPENEVNVENVMTQLYGAVAYQLYGEDFADIEELPIYLYRQGVAVIGVGGQHLLNTNPTETSLPEELFGHG